MKILLCILAWIASTILFWLTLPVSIMVMSLYDDTHAAKDWVKFVGYPLNRWSRKYYRYRPEKPFKYFLDKQ